MRPLMLRLVMALVAALVVGCQPTTPVSSGPQTVVTPENAQVDTGAEAPEGTVPTVSADQGALGAPAETSTAVFREALTAREASAAADAEATSRHADYQLYEILGCSAGAYGRYERDSHLVDGECAQWLFYYVRPVDPNSLKGYHALFVRVGPNGVLEASDEIHEEQVRKKSKGGLTDWQVDSAQAIAIAEDAGGRAYREANPEWDTARFEADRNALLIATLEFNPYWDAESGKEFGGSRNVVWVIKYPPLDELLFVIDASTGEVLLAQGG